MGLAQFISPLPTSCSLAHTHTHKIATGDTTLSDSGPAVKSVNCNVTLGFSNQADMDEDLGPQKLKKKKNKK